MTHASDGETSPEALPFPDNPLVRVEVSEEETTVFVRLGPGQELSSEDKQLVANALGIADVAESEQPGVSLETRADTETGAETPAYIVELLGRASVKGAAEGEVNEGSPRTESEHMRTTPERHALLCAIGEVLLAEGTDTSTFTERLTNSAQDDFLRLLLSRYAAFSTADPTEAFNMLMAGLNRGSRSVTRSTDAIISAAHVSFPTIITAELMEPGGRSTRRDTATMTHAAGIVSIIMKQARIPQRVVRQKLEASASMLTRMLLGDDHPSIATFQNLVRFVNENLARRESELSEQGLRPLSDGEVEWLIGRYRAERAAKYRVQSR